MFICYKEFKTKHEYPSMVDHLEPGRYDGQDLVVSFLKNKGRVVSVSCSWNVDVFTKKHIKYERALCKDEKFSWLQDLAYYVEKYNLRLPKEFEDHIFEVMSKQ